jgi:23S rRNA pseudouridine2604 synthase
MTDDGERLAKRVAALVPCSRREAEQYIAGGSVRVDGQVVEEPQFRVLGQRVTLDAGASLLGGTPATLLLHKPPGHDDGTPAPDAPRRAGSAPAARALLQVGTQWAGDEAGLRLLKRHGVGLASLVPLEWGASGLLVFSQDWRVTRKLSEDAALLEHELMVDVRGEVTADALRPLERAMRDERLRLPDFKISVGSSQPERSKLRLAVKGSHLGLALYLCELSGLEVLALRRIRVGRVSLGDLEEGAWRYLSEGERF